MAIDDAAVVRKAKVGVFAFLAEQFRRGLIDEGLYDQARQNVIPGFRHWLTDQHINRLSPRLRDGLRTAVEEARWADLVEAYVDEIKFGTAGIRGKAAMTDEELLILSRDGMDAPILKGPNTLNNIVLLLKSTGVAKYATDHGLRSIVIGYDSRVAGQDFARLVSRVFLAAGLKVYLFDEACPYPEMTFAIPTLDADMGILISASHNDRRYNGYKLSAGTGSQFPPRERSIIYNDYIRKTTPAHVTLVDFDEAGADPGRPDDPYLDGNKLVFLGGGAPLPGFDYSDRPLVNIHQMHQDQIRTFISNPAMMKSWAPSIGIGYCAFHGAGRRAVPRLLDDFGFTRVARVTSRRLDELDGLFPAFQDHPEQQPDPGDPMAAEIAVNAYGEQYGAESMERLDMMIGTDPDADRAGLVIKVPRKDRAYHENRSHVLLSADDAWSLLLWYRLSQGAVDSGESQPRREEAFIVLSHITTDALVRLARKYGVGVIRTWVGFGLIANAVERVWSGDDLSDPRFGDIIYQTVDMDDKPRSYNVACLEQSNGFSILGGPPATATAMGRNGHVRDKDGVFAAILLAEVAAYAASQGTTIYDLIDEQIYLDPDIGGFVTDVVPVPQWGEFKGLEGLTRKIDILKRCAELGERVRAGESLSLDGLPVLSSETFVAGKYADAHQWPGFPDEGIRFYFDEERLNYLTVRPSGTSQCFRFHIQLKAENLSRSRLAEQKQEARLRARRVIAAMGELVM
ncbi:MAG: hypothetical protein OXG98_06390 [Gemmatimonadetes bacterium]|nr:hypothetical protein [Gemmatimonadota bacterium]